MTMDLEPIAVEAVRLERTWEEPMGMGHALPPPGVLKSACPRCGAVVVAERLGAFTCACGAALELRAAAAFAPPGRRFTARIVEK